MRSSPRRRKLAVGLTALTLSFTGVGSAVAATPSTSTSPAFVPTATKAADTGKAILLGATPSARVLEIQVALAPRDQAAETAALKAMYTPGSPTFQRYITPAQFAAEYAPSESAISAVTGYLSRQGFTGVTVLSDHLLVTAYGTVGAIDTAFHTRVADFHVGDLSFFANTAPAEVPAALGFTVDAVLGLNDIPLANPQPARAKTKAGSPVIGNAVPPRDFQNTYGAAGTPTGSKTTIAILTEGNVSQVYKDLRLAETKFKLPLVSMSQINVGPQSNDTSAQDEFDLDTQSSTAMATTVQHVYLYNVGSLIDPEIDLAIAEFVDQDRAVAMSASLGECDSFAYLDGSMVSTDQLLEEGALQGQSLFASAGDNGFSCFNVVNTGTPAGVPGVSWPADGYFTTDVGGTTLLSDANANRVEEIGWLGGGGGFSALENGGWWTAATDLVYNPEQLRAVPDVALDADPNGTAVEIYVSGTIEYVGGTSLSSPLMLGTWARLESTHANRLGLASIDLYRVYDHVNPGVTVNVPTPLATVTALVPSPDPKPVPGFTDIIVGANGTYFCRPGYDEVTGLGAPDIAPLDRVIS